jgi:hypothetical protein
MEDRQALFEIGGGGVVAGLNLEPAKPLLRALQLSRLRQDDCRQRGRQLEEGHLGLGYALAGVAEIDVKRADGIRLAIAARRTAQRSGQRGQDPQPGHALAHRRLGVLPEYAAAL